MVRVGIGSIAICYRQSGDACVSSAEPGEWHRRREERQKAGNAGFPPIPLCPTSRPALSHPSSHSIPHSIPTTSHALMTDAPPTNEWERNRVDGTDSTSQRETTG